MNARSTILCEVYKSSRAVDTYLYVDHKDGFDRVPLDLMDRFPDPIKVLQFKLDATRTLARADPVEVMSSIDQRGYYLQLPPTRDAMPRSLDEKNNLMPR